PEMHDVEGKNPGEKYPTGGSKHSARNLAAGGTFAAWYIGVHQQNGKEQNGNGKNVTETDPVAEPFDDVTPVRVAGQQQAQRPEDGTQPLQQQHRQQQPFKNHR